MNADSLVAHIASGLKPFALGAVVALLGLGTWNVYVHYDAHAVTAASYQALSSEEKLTYWEKRIQKAGGKSAFDELSLKVKLQDPRKQHAEGHIFGEALYGVEGLTGISVCDSRLMYACFHAFTAAAIQESGPDASQRLHEACQKIFGTRSEDCDHGIGHGIQYKYSYDLDGLKQALAECETLSPPSSRVAGCGGGVFMEFNTRSMANEGSGKGRPFDIAHILEPCASLESTWVGSCAHWQTQWWFRSDPALKNPLELAANMGKWCRAMPGGEEVFDLCLEGITRRMRILTRDTPSLTATMCIQISKDLSVQYRCQLLSARRFSYYYPLEKALQACDGLPSEERTTCAERTTKESEYLKKHNATYELQQKNGS